MWQFYALIFKTFPDRPRHFSRSSCLIMYVYVNILDYECYNDIKRYFEHVPFTSNLKQIVNYLKQHSIVLVLEKILLNKLSNLIQAYFNPTPYLHLKSYLTESHHFLQPVRTARSHCMSVGWDVQWCSMSRINIPLGTQEEVLEGRQGNFKIKIKSF